MEEIDAQLQIYFKCGTLAITIMAWDKLINPGATLWSFHHTCSQWNFEKKSPFSRSIVDIFARLVSHFPYAGRNTTIKTFFPQLLLIPPLSIYKRPCNEQVADTNDNSCTCWPLNLQRDFDFSCYKANSGSRERDRIKQPRLLFNCAFGKANQRIRVNQERSESR